MRAAAAVSCLLLALLAASDPGRSAAQAEASAVLSEDALAQIIRARIGTARLTVVAKAARTLPDLGSDLTAAVCKRAAAAIVAGSQGDEEAVAAAEVAARLRCLDAAKASAAGDLLLARLRTCSTVAELSQLVHAKRALHDAYGRAPLPAEVVQAVTRLLADATAPSGKVRNKSGAGVAIESTGAAYQAVADLVAIGAVKAGADVAETLRSQAPKVLEGASSDGLHAAGDGDGLAAVAAFLQGATALQLSGLPSDKLQQLASYTAKFAAVGSAEEAVHLLAARRALRALGAAGVAFAVRTPSLRLGGGGAARVDLTDASGAPLDTSGIQAALLGASGKPTALPVTAGAGHVSVDVLAAVSEAGVLTVQLSDASGAIGRFEVEVAEAAARVASAAVAVEREDGSTAGEATAEPPHSLAQELAATAGSTLRVSLEVAEPGALPVLLLACEASGEAVAVGFKRRGDGAEAAVDLRAVAPHFQARCERFRLVVRPGAAGGAEWALAGVAVSGERPAAPPGWLEGLAPRPTIAHQFRRPDRRPARAISVAFAGAAVLPLGLLLLGLQRTRVNLKDLPRSGGHALAALVFHGSLGGLALLYTAFWVHLNLLETLPLLALLAVILFMSGHFLLSHRAAVHAKSA